MTERRSTLQEHAVAMPASKGDSVADYIKSVSIS